MSSIADIRKDYQLQSLSEEDVTSNPIDQFTKWWDDALASNIEEVNAMTLATANKEGKPSARIVLLKGMNKDGFEFFGNYESHKAKDMAENENVALVFHWKEIERQIRIEGTVSKLQETASDVYFLSRPQESKIGAWSSPQSSIIENRAVLDENVLRTRATFKDTDVTRPAFWGGYLVKPSLIEFWQGRPNRLHDRLQYTLEKGHWVLNRLAP